MAEHPEGFTPPHDDSSEGGNSNGELGDSQPLQGQVRHNNLSARVPESIGQGVLSNGVMILTGTFELVIDFVLRMGEQNRIVSRCILPPAVASQLVGALRENMHNFETRFGPLPTIPKPLSASESTNPETEAPKGEDADPAASHPENRPSPVHQPTIQDLYDDLKIADETMSGSYANAVLIRHSNTEFCFDFITNFYPKSAVSARVFLAVPHVRPFLSSLERALTPPGTSPEVV